MKNKNIIVIFLFALIITACGKSKDIKKNTLKTQFINLPKGENFYSAIDTLRIENINILKKIISLKTAQKAAEEVSCLEITSTVDSAKIKKAIFNGFNINLELHADSLTNNFNVRLEKAIPQGGSIYQTLTELGMKNKDVGFYAWKMGEYIDAGSIKPGDILAVDYVLDSLNVKNFKNFSYKPDKSVIHEFAIKGERNLAYKIIELPFELKRRFLSGEITAKNPTLDGSLKALGIPAYIRQQANNALQAQISFSTDARPGDTFEVYIEEKFIDDEKQPQGKMLFVQYSGKYTKTKSAYRFTDKEKASSFSGMYTPGGKRLVINAVRTPLDRMHVTSPFGYRIHPLTGRRRMHNGIDLRGSTGTNVYAITSGKVIKAVNSGNGYGKEVRIRHANGMISQYAHLSRITTRRGRRVKKGQIIGKVGSTGFSTGPHLHFGLKRGGRWVNPKTNIKMVGANKLTGKRMKRFKMQMKEYNSETEAIKSNTSGNVNNTETS
ncbi:MAG: hypothetical protein CSB55_08310 [Candidatus Cloacimonadota bacterium]|nr:MAG: hypothetical protein CSB55_08310 [Candidatus Cloacimonadota bacterium]